MHDLANTIFGPVISVLSQGIVYLNSIIMVASRGLDLDNFLGPIGALGGGWVLLVKSLISSFVLVSVVFGVKAIYSLYLQSKDGVKWW